MSKQTASIVWDATTTDEKLATALNVLAEDYEIFRDGDSAGDIRVKFENVDNPDILEVCRNGNDAFISYGSIAMALRGISSLMSGAVEDGKTYYEKRNFNTFGIMLDCSRNAVMTVTHFKKWLRRLALLGYNMSMLYTEDTYELPDEPYFGHMRGAYTQDELREIDDYAFSLGIEMVPCIQTLGHMEQILKWKSYGEVKDTHKVLLVGDDETHKLIEKMISHWNETFRSRRIHIGMDEAYDLGSGRYLDKNGYTPAIDIFNSHLSKVVEICEKHGLSPMIWSDMYFCMGSKTRSYHDKDCVVPDEVAAAIPRQVQLVYWEYYNTQKEWYLDWIGRHRKMGFEPIMASGIWTWKKVWHDQFLSDDNCSVCIEGCREAGVKEIFFTMWGDNGSYCDFDSAFAGLALVAEKSFAESFNKETLAARYAAVCKGSYQANLNAAELMRHLDPEYIIWEDPLLEMHLLTKRAENENAFKELEAHFRGIVKSLEPYGDDDACGDLNHAILLALNSASRLRISEELIIAYRAKDKEALANVSAMLPEATQLMRQLADSYRKVWHSHNKPFGLEFIQVRCWGILARLEELDRRLQEYINGEIPTIAELDSLLAKDMKADTWWRFCGYPAWRLS